MQIEIGVLITVGAYLVGVGLWLGRLHAKVSELSARVDKTEANDNEMHKTLMQLLVEMQRLSTLIDERTKPNRP